MRTHQNTALACGEYEQNNEQNLLMTIYPTLP